MASIFGKQQDAQQRDPLQVQGAEAIGSIAITKIKIYRILPLGDEGDFEVRTVPAPGHNTVHRDYKVDFFKGWMIEEEFEAIRARFRDLGVELYQKGTKPPDEAWIKERMGDQYQPPETDGKGVNVHESERGRCTESDRQDGGADPGPRRKAVRKPRNRGRSKATNG